jgi:nucleotide-binding universal stress UspA family protein
LSGTPIKLLLAVDDSEYSPHVAETAAHLFGGKDPRVVVLSVVEEPRGPGTEVGPEEMKAQERKRFNALHGRIVANYFGGNQNVESMILEGSPADVICQKAKETGSDLIIMGTRGRGKIQRALLGSVSEDVIMKATVPVTVVTKARVS